MKKLKIAQYSNNQEFAASPGSLIENKLVHSSRKWLENMNRVAYKRANNYVSSASLNSSVEIAGWSSIQVVCIYSLYKNVFSLPRSAAEQYSDHAEEQQINFANEWITICLPMSWLLQQPYHWRDLEERWEGLSQVWQQLRTSFSRLQSPSLSSVQPAASHICWRQSSQPVGCAACSRGCCGLLARSHAYWSARRSTSEDPAVCR